MLIHTEVRGVDGDLLLCLSSMSEGYVLDKSKGNYIVPAAWKQSHRVHEANVISHRSFSTRMKCLTLSSTPLADGRRTGKSNERYRGMDSFFLSSMQLPSECWNNNVYRPKPHNEEELMSWYD